MFCDLGTPGPDWNVYDELRHQLTARGLPREAIRFIHEAKTDRDKGRLFAACRTGSVAVLIGSTEKMGVGTNVQDRAIALHHLDAPWRPADVAQREGRILRQGNLNPEVSIIRYVTERSFDGYMWQTLERKARFITQVMHGRLDTREIADIGDTALSFSEVKALATGNPLLMDKAEADAALARLQRAERAHRRNQDGLRQALDHFEAEIARLTQLATTIDAAIKRRRDTHGDQFTMTVGGRRHDKRADAGQHLKQLAERELAALTGSLERSVSAGQLGGFPVTVALDRSLGRTHVTFSLEGAPGATIELAAHDIRGADPVGLVTRLENRLSRLEERKATALADTDHARREITTPATASASPSRTLPNSPRPTTALGRLTKPWSAWPDLTTRTPRPTRPMHRGDRTIMRRTRPVPQAAARRLRKRKHRPLRGRSHTLPGLLPARPPHRGRPPVPIGGRQVCCRTGLLPGTRVEDKRHLRLRRRCARVTPSRRSQMRLLRIGSRADPTLRTGR